MATNSLTEARFVEGTERLRPALTRHAARRCGPTAAPDLVQETLLIAWQKRAVFNPDTGSAGLARWLFAILDTVCDAFLLRMGQRQEYLLPNEDASSLAETASVPDLDGEIWLALRAELYALLERVKLTRRQEVCLHLWLEGQSQEQVARTLSLSQPTVWEHIRAAIRTLQAAKEEPVSAWALRLFALACQVPVYHRPPRTGAALAREKLRKRR